jgi:hypothetical protein
VRQKVRKGAAANLVATGLGGRDKDLTSSGVDLGVAYLNEDGTLQLPDLARMLLGVHKGDVLHLDCRHGEWYISMDTSPET